MNINWTTLTVVLLILGTVSAFIGARKSDKEIAGLQTEVKNVKAYSIYAMMNIYGSDRVVDGGPGITVTQQSDLYDRMSKFLVRTGNTAGVKNDPALLPDIDTVIMRYPNFPFGYYVKSQLLLAMGKPEWKIAAQQAVNVLEITTSIAGHAPSQDDALNVLKDQLSK